MRLSSSGSEKIASYLFRKAGEIKSEGSPLALNFSDKVNENMGYFLFNPLLILFTSNSASITSRNF